MFRIVPGLVLALFASLAQAAGPAPEGARIAFLGITWLDTSTEGDIRGSRPEETARVARTTQEVASRFEEEGYELVDLAPVRERLDATVNPANCYGCDIRMGKKLGADFVLVGEVQKTSNLILDMNLQLRAVPSGELVAGKSVSIRGNTDESWSRGIHYLLDTAIFRKDAE